MQSLEALFEHTLKDIYYAEKAILKALPKMSKKAASKKLAQAFTDHVAETEAQVQRLESIFEMIGKRAQGKKCPAIDGLVEEANELIKEAEDETVRDAGMLAAAQAVEHYEISRYGTLAAWADKLGMDEAADLLRETLDEEKTTDSKLSDLAESEINVEAHDEAANEDEDEPPASRPKAARPKTRATRK